MKLTKKNLKVSANINMAYVLNYLVKYMGFSPEDAFKVFIASECYKTLCRLESGLCTALSPEVLFIFEEEQGITLNENDEKLSGAFDINQKLQYMVNISEAYREEKGISTDKYKDYILKHNIWHSLDVNYEYLSTLKRAEVIRALSE